MRTWSIDLVLLVFVLLSARLKSILNFVFLFFFPFLFLSFFFPFRIDHNVEDTVMNVEAGYGELLKYFKGISSNRWLMVKIFLVVLVFFIIFVVFMT